MAHVLVQFANLRLLGCAFCFALEIDRSAGPVGLEESRLARDECALKSQPARRR